MTKNKLKFKWLEVKDLDKSKLDATLSPVKNAVLQFGYDIRKPEILKMFQDDKAEPSWYSVLGWSKECEDVFWKMLVEHYGKNKDKLHLWGGMWMALARHKKAMPSLMTLDMPTNFKEVWEKKRREDGDILPRINSWASRSDT